MSHFLQKLKAVGPISLAVAVAFGLEVAVYASHGELHNLSSALSLHPLTSRQDLKSAPKPPTGTMPDTNSKFSDRRLA